MMLTVTVAYVLCFLLTIRIDLINIALILVFRSLGATEAIKVISLEFHSWINLQVHLRFSVNWEIPPYLVVAYS